MSAENTKKWTNEYGWDEWYEIFSLSHERSGHIITGEDDCGICDGCMCESCQEWWTLYEMGVTEKIPYPHIVSFERFDDEYDARQRWTERLMEL